MAIPHLEGKTVVDGDVRIPVRGGGACGCSARAGGVRRQHARTGTASTGRILRYQADGTRTVIARGEVFEAQLSSDGLRVLAGQVPRRSARS